MATIQLANVIAELEERMAAIRPLREGAEDLGSIDDLRPDTKRECAAAVAEYQKELDTLQAGKNALQAILDLGYPAIPAKRMVSGEVMADIQDNLSSVTKAAQEFATPIAESADLVLGEGVPIP